MTAGMPAGEWGAAFASASVPAMTVYAEVMVPRIFEPWAHVLLARLAVEPGEAVLDVACGPGSVTRLAAARSGPTGRVTGCDVSPAMLMIAAGLGQVTGGASIDYRQASADCLPVPDEDFDVVCCQQGLQFFPDRQAALAEMRRALRPGGRIGIAVWKHIEQSRPFAILETAIRTVAGAQIADRYRTGPWGLPDAADLYALLSNAGFADITVTSHELAVTFEAGGEQLAGTLAASGVASELQALPAQDKARLRAVVTELSRPLQAGGGALRSHLASNLAIARR
jgi:ubiquinone/menaquinone biosynthesis C-methylase UbiE